MSSAPAVLRAAGLRPNAPRLLIISAAFPPSAAAGAVRLERLAEGVGSGWQVDAITWAGARMSVTTIRVLEPPGTESGA
jgi:hypothetical protein